MPENVGEMSNAGYVMDSEHDRAFLQILKEEKNVTNFLDAFFGFMYRCTDFYVESTSDQKLGFPPGVAEVLVLKILHKWKSKYENERLLTSRVQVPISDLPEPIQEVEVNTEDNRSEEEPVKATPIQPSDSYNGAVREGYSWSQTINDVDVLVNIPTSIKKGKDLKVDVTADGIRIAAKTEILNKNKDPTDQSNGSANSEWTVIFDGELSFKTQREESIWCIIPGKHVNIHLEKATERWWEALIKGEPNIELSKIDCSRPIDDLGDNEQMKVQELMWNHQQKLLGKPTSEQINLEKVLKKAWDVEGSPFKGTEYDPSVLNFN